MKYYSSDEWNESKIMTLNDYGQSFRISCNHPKGLPMRAKIKKYYPQWLGRLSKTRLSQRYLVSLKGA